MFLTLNFLLFILSIGASRISADGAIGCLFSSVCQSDEVCANDSLFGICVPGALLALDIVPDFTVETTNEQKVMLTRFLRLLGKRGYTWKDDETQCAIKWLIESFKSSRSLQPPPCLSAISEELPEQGQKRVSESLAHAFQSYMPQDGVDENEHIIEKYPRVKNSVFVGKQLSNLGQYLASARPDATNFIELENSDEEDDDSSPAEGEMIAVPVVSVSDDGDEGIDEGDDDVVIVPVTMPEADDSNDEDEGIPVVLEESDDDSDEDASESQPRLVFGPQLMPQLRTGGMSPFLANRVELIADNGDDDDSDESNEQAVNVNKLMLARMLAVGNGAREEVKVEFDRGSKLGPNALRHSSAVVSSDAVVVGDPRKGTPVTSDVKMVETNYAYVQTEPSINSATAASAFLDCAVAQIGEERSKAIIILDSWHDAVVFEVRDPDGKLTASLAAKEIESNADKIRANCNRHVRAVGIGRRAHLALRQQEAALAQTAEAQGTLSRWSASHTAIVAILIIVSVCIAGSVVVFVLLRVALRKGSLKHALGSVQGKFRDWKTRRFYEDLCRESIATKAGSAKVGLGEVVASGSSRHQTPPPSPPPWAEEPRPTDLDVSTAHVVLAYMEEHLKNRSRLEEEWGELCGYAPDRSDLSIANLVENASKNREINVVPYDHNRVKLCSESNAFKSDYINASHIVDTDPRRPAYVVTQSPLAETVADFWQLVWEQKSTLIVYLSQPSEPKAVRYWPDEGLTLYHRWQVGLVSEHAWNEDFIVRSLVLKDTATGDSRTVTQFHFLAWPSDGVPKLCRSILAFRRKANRSYRPHASPIIVQSTNGGGRAGAYILLDMTLNHIAKGAREVDISASLEHLRDQRVGLVKTKEQFEFVLICVAEEIAAIVKSSRDGSGNSSPE